MLVTVRKYSSIVGDTFGSDGPECDKNEKNGVFVKNGC